MTTFQLVMLPLLIILALITAVHTVRRRVASRPGVAWLLLWIGGAIAVAFPDSLTALAELLGIGRGVDLVLYLSILFMFVAFFVVYLRFRRMDEQLTRIVRKIAVEEALNERRP